MLFSSMIFLWGFLPIVLLGNQILNWIPFADRRRRMKLKNDFLLVTSLVFYGFGGIRYLLLMAAVIVLNYMGGLLIHFVKTEGRNAAWVLGGVVLLDLGILFVFKYLGMFTGVSPELPIGISFYTFQAITYVADVYTEKVPVQKRLVNFALYVSFFPQLIAGPIVQYGDIEKQLGSRKESPEKFGQGVKRFCYGIAKKVLLANTFGKITDDIWGLELSQLGAGVAWLGLICYTLQIYYDFSGYSDMAIGLGKMFGFSFKENFRYPYTGTSVQDFWRRWHLSLSGFFRDYVYIPLGGSRKGIPVTCRNVMIVFLLTGIWHGANYTFWVWGIYYGVLMVAERLFLGKLLQKNPLKPLNWIYTMVVVMLGWAVFRADSLSDAWVYLGQLFRTGRGEYSILSYISYPVLLAFPAAVLGCGFLQKIAGGFWERHKSDLWLRILDGGTQLMLLVLSILWIVSGTYNPFIYFQF